jgi:ankyrin repeat protein
MSKSSEEVFLDSVINKKFNKSNLEKFLKDKKFNLEYRNKEKETFLHICLKQKKLDAAMWLISNNISLDKEDKDGKTPFDIAIENQNHRVLKMILDRQEVDLNKKNKFGRTILQDAVLLGDHDMAKLLIEYGADLNSYDIKGRNIIFDAISYGNKEFIEYLLELGTVELNGCDCDGNTIMHYSLVQKDKELALKLIQHGADPNIQGEDGKSYLCNLALQGEDGIEAIETIVKGGVDINARLSDENTILIELMSALYSLNPEDEARRQSLLKVSKTLIENKIDINALNSNNENALFDAVKAGDAKQVSLLLKSGIEVNVQNKQGETPLSFAVYGGVEKLDITALLLEYKADPKIENSKNKTLYEVLNELILSSHGKKELKDNQILKYALGGTKFIHVLKSLLDHTHPRDLHLYDSTGNPLFFMPLLYNSIPVFRLYQRSGINMSFRNKFENNLFFEYVLKVFKDDDPSVDFQSGLSMLISAKVDHNTQDETGWTVVSKVIGKTSCNIELFKILVKVVKFDYYLVDKLGRTVIHTAVWSSNIEVIKIINYIKSDIKDIPDHYGILPVIYAALLGDRELVLYFIEVKAKLSTKAPISKSAIKKFSPLLKNIQKLTEGLDEDSDDMYNIKIVIGQLKKDFVL